MEQKDYEEIARIINQATYTKYGQLDGDISRNHLVEKLADYFERERNEEIDKFSQLDCNCPSPFNRKQFLKDCGVEK